MKIYRRKVQKIIDGDTFTIRNRVNGSQRVRIAGLNCPEKNQPGFQKAKQSLSRKIKGKTVLVKPVGKSYGRTVADVVYRRRSLKGKC